MWMGGQDYFCRVCGAEVKFVKKPVEEPEMPDAPLLRKADDGKGSVGRDDGGAIWRRCNTRSTPTARCSTICCGGSTVFPQGVFRFHRHRRSATSSFATNDTRSRS